MSSAAISMKSSSAAHPSRRRGTLPQTDRLPLHHCLRHDGMRSYHLFQPLGNLETGLLRKSHHPHGSKIDSPDPQHVAGEIICRGSNLMLGYYKNAEATSQIIDVNGWLHTGDLATMDADGYVTVRGRSKNMLLTSSGQNIYPEEIESKLNNMPYVSESLIVLQHDKLVALIYPDFDDAFAHGLQQTDIEKAMEANRNELNLLLPHIARLPK